MHVVPGNIVGFNKFFAGGTKGFEGSYERWSGGAKDMAAKDKCLSSPLATCLELANAT